MNNDDRIAEYNKLIENIDIYYRNLNIDSLCELVEYVRSEGLFYLDFHDKKTELLSSLLSVSLKLICNPQINSQVKVWFIVRDVYDINFHQVQLIQYPQSCGTLYFDLTIKVLDENFQPLFEGDNMIYEYGECVNFIDMADNWFADKEIEFIKVYKKLKELTVSRPSYMNKQWIIRYRELTQN